MPDCIFCKIIKGELPSKQVYRSPEVIVFHDINPKAPVHLLIVPVKHISSLIQAKVSDKNLLGDIMLIAKKEATRFGLDKSGYKIVINNGKDAGQLVFHLHLHLLGGWTKSIDWDV